MGAAATLPLRPGDRVAERYDVERVLGVGGMGAVVAATDRETGQRVAIKVLLPELTRHADVVARFAREARATARLQSEHVARVLDSGALAGGAPFIVMEHLDGRDLKSLLRAEGPLSVRDAAAYVCQACGAVAEAHALGIVHRDLKPANLFLTRRDDGSPIIKVLDFGIAKFQSPNNAGDHLEMTRTRAVLGSRAYMSPEQMLRPRDVDARADIWALGAILYFLLAGRSPFAAETTEALILNVVQGEPTPLSELRPDVPAGVEAVLARCLAKDRNSRFSNVTELARALAPFATVASDRATVELTAESVDGLAVTCDESSDPEIDPDADTRESVPSWAPTRVMDRPVITPIPVPRPRRLRLPTGTMVVAAVLGFAGALFLIHKLLPERAAPPPVARIAPRASLAAPIAGAVASAPPVVSASSAPPVVSSVPIASSAPPVVIRAPVRPKPLPKAPKAAVDTPW